MKIAFEVGHDAVPKNKRTQEGFTHDWEVYVKGIDGAEIHHYIDKVVFNLHETFPKPKRGTSDKFCASSFFVCISFLIVLS